MTSADLELRPRTDGAAVRARRPIWTNPVVQFVVAGLIALAVLIVGSGMLSEQAATREAIADAKSTTVLLARSVVEPALPRGLMQGRASALDRLDRLVRHRLLGGRILRVKIWTANGRIVYSDANQLIGHRFTLGGEERDILLHGGTAAEVSDLSRPENQFEKSFGRLLEVYTQVHVRRSAPLLFEVYFSYGDISQRSAEVLNAFRPITVAGLLVFLVLTGSLVWVLARRLDTAAASRERLLVAAVNASDAERRRIARDLHDGVVQDLAGTSFALSAAARDVADRPAVASTLASLGTGVRHSLRALRSLLVEIYPPNLRSEGLAAALDDLVAPMTAAGVSVQLEVGDTTELPDDVTALIWRGAQEAVRNATIHGRATSLSIVVQAGHDSVRLEVSDDGRGFDPSQLPAHGHFGLRGLRDLVTEAGGRLDVASAPGAGTRLQMKVPIR
jgi:signal transduction histidine kinase